MTSIDLCATGTARAAPLAAALALAASWAAEPAAALAREAAAAALPAEALTDHFDGEEALPAAALIVSPGPAAPPAAVPAPSVVPGVVVTSSSRAAAF